MCVPTSGGVIMEQHLFIADLHFGHNGIHEKFRTEFDSQEDHDDCIHGNILAAASTTKTLWILGDSFLKTNEFWRLEEYRLKYQQVNIILGNHCHTGLPRYALQFKNVNVFGVQKKFGYWLTHVPVPYSELYRGKCIHGHTHSNKVGEWEHVEYGFGGVEADIFVEDKRYFCVSCENINYAPISLQKIKELRGWE